MAENVKTIRLEGEGHMVAHRILKAYANLHGIPIGDAVVHLVQEMDMTEDLQEMNQEMNTKFDR